MRVTNLPPEQEAIRAKCFHPSGKFEEFSKEDVETSIPARFEKMVARYPDNPAVVTASQSLSYAELNRWANRVAHSIIDQRGVGSEPIGLLFETKLVLIVAMLAVLKAGKFVVLLDPATPQARLRAILNDAQAKLVLMEEPTTAMARDLDENQVLDIGRLGNDSCNDDLRLPISPETLLCISYTSGSTGEPKGVAWNHGNMLHQVMLFTNEFHYCDRDRISYLTSGTAAAIQHPFLALLVGAVVLPFDLKRAGIIAFVKWLAQEKISVCSLSAPLFRSVADNLTGQELFPDLRLLRLSSEAAYKTDFERFCQKLPSQCLLANGIAPAETFLFSTYLMDHESVVDTPEIPIGYPVWDKEILLIDDADNEVGFDQIGEIVVRSAYLAPGYWNRPELTAAKFSRSACSTGERLYRTGDLGLRQPDGCLIHKGRKDFRTKIRGYGVEPAEIEVVLRQHPGVREVCVVYRADEVSGASGLVAYFTRDPGVHPVSSELRTFLNSRLPDYMIPAVFLPLAELPLTANGKVNRAALPAPAAIRPELNVPYAAPTNECEARLTKIWCDVLGLGFVGIRDNFFDLGGDSLSASRVISQIIKYFQLEIPLHLLFQSPTIADLALVVAQHQGKLSTNDKQDHVAGPPLVPASRERLFPVSYSQERLWFLDQLDPGSFTYNVFSAYQLNGELNGAALEQSFNEIIRRHEVLRTVFKSVDGSPQQVVLPTLTITIPILDLRGIVSADDRWTEVRRLAKEEAQRLFDLTQAPLIRVTVLWLADDEYLLFRAMHHIIYDAWSGGVLFRELESLYEAFANGQRSPLTDLPSQYADYAVWQRQRLEGEILESQLSYWRKQLENIPILRLPTDRPRPAHQSSRGARQYFTLSNTLSSELKSLSRRQGVTVFMTVLAAFETLLHRYSGQTDIVIGSPVANRTRREFEGLIGFFLNTLVLRLDLSGNPKFTETISRAREMSLGALSHQELPFEKLVEELQPERGLGNNPFFQVVFSFQNTPRFPPRLHDVTINEVELETGIARFDLHILVEERDGQLKGYCDYDTNLFQCRYHRKVARPFSGLTGRGGCRPRSADL
jgi:amino acid adenylation domain-containing protein